MRTVFAGQSLQSCCRSAILSSSIPSKLQPRLARSKLDGWCRYFNSNPALGRQGRRQALVENVALFQSSRHADEPKDRVDGSAAFRRAPHMGVCGTLWRGL